MMAFLDRPVRWWNGFWFAKGSPYNLAAARVLFSLHGVWLLLSRDLPSMSGLPAEMWAAVSPHVQWRYLMFHGHPEIEYGVQAIALAALIAAALGLWPHISFLLSAVLLYHLAPLETVIITSEPTTRGFEITILATAVLAFAPCADVWSVRRRSPRDDWEYGWPLRLLQLFVVQIYFFSGWAKLMWTGFNWISVENMRGYILYSNLTEPVTFTKLGIFLTGQPLLLWLLAFGSVVFELAFPAVLFSRAARYVLIPLGFLFHIGILFSLNIAFPGVSRLLIFVNWDCLRLRALRVREE